jgi:hypothetical protein
VRPPERMRRRPLVAAFAGRRALESPCRRERSSAIVDEADEVRTVEDHQLEAVPGGGNFIDTIAKVEDRLIILLALESLFAGSSSRASAARTERRRAGVCTGSQPSAGPRRAQISPLMLRSAQLLASR